MEDTVVFSVDEWLLDKETVLSTGLTTTKEVGPTDCFVVFVAIDDTRYRLVFDAMDDSKCLSAWIEEFTGKRASNSNAYEILSLQYDSAGVDDGAWVKFKTAIKDNVFNFVYGDQSHTYTYKGATKDEVLDLIFNHAEYPDGPTPMVHDITKDELEDILSQA